MCVDKETDHLVTIWCFYLESRYDFAELLTVW